MFIYLALLLFSVKTHYLEIPPMGRITSIAASPNQILLINSEYLVFLSKRENFKFVYSYRPPETPTIVGYDLEWGDFWVMTKKNIFRINEYSYSIRNFNIESTSAITSLAIGPGYLYWYDKAIPVRFNKRNGKIERPVIIPAEVTWFKLLSTKQLRKFPFLAPYYFQDEKFNQYPISALLEDGFDLLVGSDGFGLYKFNKFTWEKEHIAFAPFTPYVRELLKESDGLYFVGDNSVTYYDYLKNSYEYTRFDNRIDAFIPLQNKFIVSSANRLLSIEANFVYPLGEPVQKVTDFSPDGTSILYATDDGIFQLNTETNTIYPLGLTNTMVNKILPDSDFIYAATEKGLFKFDRATKKWERLIAFPFIDLLKYQDRHFLISSTHQLYELVDDSLNILPYMNIFCFECDSQYLYLGTILGLAIYDPQRKLYRHAHFVPKEKIISMAILRETVWLLTERSIITVALSELR